MESVINFLLIKHWHTVWFKTDKTMVYSIVLPVWLVENFNPCIFERIRNFYENRRSLRFLLYCGFRDLSSILPVNQELSFAFQVADDVTELPRLPLFDAFQSQGISHFHFYLYFHFLHLSVKYSTLSNFHCMVLGLVFSAWQHAERTICYRPSVCRSVRLVSFSLQFRRDPPERGRQTMVGCGLAGNNLFS